MGGGRTLDEEEAHSGPRRLRSLRSPGDPVSARQPSTAGATSIAVLIAPGTRIGLGALVDELRIPRKSRLRKMWVRGNTSVRYGLQWNIRVIPEMLGGFLI